MSTSACGNFPNAMRLVMCRGQWSGTFSSVSGGIAPASETRSAGFTSSSLSIHAETSPNSPSSVLRSPEFMLSIRRLNSGLMSSSLTPLVFSISFIRARLSMGSCSLVTSTHPCLFRTFLRSSDAGKRTTGPLTVFPKVLPSKKGNPTWPICSPVSSSSWRMFLERCFMWFCALVYFTASGLRAPLCPRASKSEAARPCAILSGSMETTLDDEAAHELATWPIVPGTSSSHMWTSSVELFAMRPRRMDLFLLSFLMSWLR